MNHISVSRYPDRWGVRLLLDGKELPELRKFDLHVPTPDEVPTLIAEVLAYKDLDVELDAQVTVNVVALPGYVLEVEKVDGKTVYRTREG